MRSFDLGYPLSYPPVTVGPPRELIAVTTHGTNVGAVFVRIHTDEIARHRSMIAIDRYSRVEKNVLMPTLRRAGVTRDKLRKLGGALTPHGASTVLRHRPGARVPYAVIAEARNPLRLETV